MREYKFRGKAVKYKEWVYGSYVIASSGHFIVSFNAPQKYCGGWEHVTGIIEVDPETVGQYAELTDKNGKKIFGGDVLLNSNYNDPLLLEFRKIGIVGFAYGGFVVYDAGDEPCQSRRYLSLNQDYDEIIGNVRDNPELLEVK